MWHFVFFLHVERLHIYLLFFPVEYVQGGRIGLKITDSLRLEISENEKVMLGNKNIDQMDSFTYLGSIISKNCGSSVDVKSIKAKT